MFTRHCRAFNHRVSKISLVRSPLNGNRTVVLGILAILLLSTPLALDSQVASGQNGFDISSQTTISLGQSIDLRGTVCPNPSNTFEFVVVVNYTDPTGQVVSKNEQIGYGTVSLCSAPFNIDTMTIFNTTGTWQVVAQAQWVDGSGSSQTMNSNAISFNVVVSQSATTNSTTTSSVASTTLISTTTTSTSIISTFSSSSSNTCSTGCGAVGTPTSTSSQNVTLNKGQVSSLVVNITGPSYLAYYAVSAGGAIEEAVLSADQYNTFTQYGQTLSLCDGSAASYSASCGTSLINGLLIYPGTYYLTVYSPQSTTKVYYGYNSSLSLQVVNATTFVGAFFTLDSQSNGNFLVHPVTLGSPSTLQLFGISTQPVQYVVQNLLANRSVVFKTPYLTTTNLNGTMPTQTISPYYYVSLPPGLYNIEAMNGESSVTDAYIEYQLIPAYVNPYYLSMENQIFGGGPTTSRPTGVASFGIYNSSGSILPYPQPINTSGLVGGVLINAIKTNITQANYEDASNQLNGMLVVLNKDGTQGVYWAQDVPAFVTSQNKMELDDDVLNVSGDYANLYNTTITSPYNNIVSYDPSSGQGYFGIQDNNSYYMNSGLLSYTLPLQYAAIMNEGVIPGAGVEINMSVDFLKGVSHLGVVTFDQIMIHDPDIQDAYFYVSGTEYTPAGLVADRMFYDAENIFGGGGGGASGYFTQFNATVNVGYWNDQSQNFTLFPSAYSFGADTGESADNLHSSYLGNGAVGLSVGNTDWGYLYPSTMASNSTTRVVGGGTGSSITTVTSTSSRTNTTTNNGPSGFVTDLVIVAIVAIAGVASLFLLRKRKVLPLPPPPPA